MLSFTGNLPRVFAIETGCWPSPHRYDRLYRADEELSKLYRALPYVTLRLCFLAAEHFSAVELLASVKVEHEPFYRRAFDFRLICKSRAWSPFTKPVSLMRVHFPGAAQELYRRYPFFRSALHERRRLFERNLKLL